MECCANCLQWPHLVLYTSFEAKYDLKLLDNEIFAKKYFSKNHTSYFCILAPEGPREEYDTAKCSQWPHLYTTYKAT